VKLIDKNFRGAHGKNDYGNNCYNSKNNSKKAKRLSSMFYSQRIEKFSCEWCEWFFIRIIRSIRKDPPLHSSYKFVLCDYGM